MKTKHYLIGLVVTLIANLSMFAQNNVNKTNIVSVPKLTVNYSKLTLVDTNHMENGMIGELYKDGSNNELFIVKSIEKNQVITWKGTKHITYDPDGSYSKITCEGIPLDCKGEIIKNDNDDIIGGKITIIH